MTAAMDDVLAERKRQIEIEGFTSERDDKYEFGELADAAAVYAMSPTSRHIIVSPYLLDTIRDRLWPWAMMWWKPGKRRRELVKAGALIIAEIERLDRKEAKKLCQQEQQ